MSNAEFERLQKEAAAAAPPPPPVAPPVLDVPSLWHVLMMAARVAVENLRRAWFNFRRGERLAEGLDERFAAFQIGAALLLLGLLGVD